MRRRTLLGLPAAGLVGVAALSACGEDAPVPPSDDPSSDQSADGSIDGRTTYGDDPAQFGELHLPEGAPRGVVVVIHGGFWLQQYDYTLGTPLAESLAEQGWAAWNLEYRRVGGGGGTPETFDDVAAGIDRLADLDLDLSTVVALGHSAGGHLAAWAAARSRYEQWQPARVEVTHVVSQAGVLDLVGGAEAGLGGGAVEGLLGHEPTTGDEPFDPLQEIPLDVPVWCVHGDSDGNVPIEQSETYVDAATRAGATAELVRVEGDHFALIDTGSSAWARQLEILDSIG